MILIPLIVVVLDGAGIVESKCIWVSIARVVVFDVQFMHICFSFFF